MIIYRNIGPEELLCLFNGKTVYGKFSSSCEAQNTSNLDEVICCFADKVRWVDKFHQFLVALEIPEERILERGIGTYFASEKFAKTGVWTGRRGSHKYKLKEVYIKSYDINDVSSINEVSIKCTGQHV